MAKTVKVDLLRVYETDASRVPFLVLTWGDQVNVTKVRGKFIDIEVWTADKPDGNVEATKRAAVIKVPKGMTADDVVTDSDQRILKLNFCDVQQGDACVLESPSGKIVLVDGGANQMFARYLAARFRNSSNAKPQEIDAIVVSHGDADHFAGLTKIYESETNATAAKRLFIHPKRIFHNGIFKRPAKRNGKARKETELLNDTVEVDETTYLQPLVDEVSKETDLNQPFSQWVDAIKAWRKRGKVTEQRLELGDEKAFDFLKEDGLEVQVLGPITEEVNGEPALPFLGEPPPGPKIGHDSLSTSTAEFGGASSSHTINGHSIVLRVVYGGFSFLLTGDLNDQSERTIVRRHNEGKLNLRADVLKAPHHGSADFSPAFLQAVGASVAIISSGDESELVEYIHPRATLVGALGRYSRAAEPIVLCTELVAFFKQVGWSSPSGESRSYYGFERTAYGMVKTRCDGKRLLVVTSSGKDSLKEAYAFDLDEHGAARPAVVRQA